MRHFVLVLKLSLVSIPALAQQDAVVLQHISAKNGLSNNGINGLLKDKRGFLWIATSGGLNRLDGRQIKTFHYHPRDTQTLSNNWVTALLDDKKGNIWIGTRNGICVIDPFSLIIRRVLPEKRIKDNDVLLVNSLTKDPNGQVCAATSLGLFEVSPSGLKEIIIPVKNNPAMQSVIRQAAFDKKGNLFLAGGNKIYVRQAGRAEAEFYSLTEVGKNNLTVSIENFFITPDGNTWISTFSHGIFHLNTADGRVKKIPEPVSFTSFSNAGKNLFFLAGNTKGIFLLNASLEKITTFISTGPFLQQQDKAGVNVVLYDEADGLWIGTGNGIYLLDIKKNDIRFISFEHLLAGVEKKEIVNASLISKRPAMLFVTLIDGGYFFYDTYANKKMPLPPELLPWLPQDAYIDRIEQASDGVVLFTSLGAGVIEWDPVEEKAISWNKKFNTDIFTNVLGMINDNRFVWVSGKNGIRRYDKTTGETIMIKTPEKNIQQTGTSYYSFRVFKQDKKGIIWCLPAPIRNIKPCIGRILPGSNEINLFKYDPSDTSSLPVFDQLSDLEIDNNDMVWCASANGLISWPSVTGKPAFRHFTTEDGLSSERIYTVLADKTGKIWCGTAYGLSVYDPARNFFSNYYREDGLNRDIIFYLHKGFNDDMIVASWAGVDIISVNGLQQQLPAGLPLVSEVKINNVYYPVQEEEITGGEPIKLNYKQNMIAVGFVWPGYRNPNNISYSYKLSGVDDDWVKTRNNTVSYANLREGKYVFEVKTLNSTELASDKTTRLVFIISPPFWRRWWFMTASALAITGLGYYLFQLRIARIKERYRLRTKIAADLHDEIGSTLTSINILSNVSQQAFEKDPAKVKEMLGQIASQSKTVQQNMNDIVWAIRPDNEKIEDLLIRMREYAAQTLEPQNIKTTISIEASLMNKVLPLTYRKEVLLIYKESVINIAKHAGAGEVSISIEYSGQRLTMNITDNGSWKANGETSGAGLHNMRQRAKAIGAELLVHHNKSGTMVQLSIPIP
jgi:signal transduction histidine kinase/streptogramin lyase